MSPFIAPTLTFTLLCCSAASVRAADLEAPAALPQYSGREASDFSGLHAGADIGAALGSAGGAHTSGYVGGAHLGYTFQAGRLTGGAEIDTFTTSLSSGRLAASDYSQKFLSSLRGRAGLVFADLMLYGTLGFGYSTSAFRDGTGIARATIKGASYGVGAEWSPVRRIGLRIEMLRYDFGANTYVTPTSVTSLRTSTNLLRAGANLRF